MSEIRVAHFHFLRTVHQISDIYLIIPAVPPFAKNKSYGLLAMALSFCVVMDRSILLLRVL